MTDLRVNLAGVELKNPIVVPSGTFGFGREDGQFFDLSELGAICVKGLTPLRREGNPAPRIAETPMGILNSVGLQNPGVDAFIAEGTESGGHVGELTTMALVPQVCDAVDLPVVAAGGVADGRQLTAAFALGACGIQVGTCLLASEECPIHPNYKQAVLKAKDSDTVVTGRSIGGPVRILKNKMAREYLALEKRGASLEELEKVTLGGLRRAVLEGDVEMGSVMSGQVAGMLHEIRPVAEIFRDLYESGIARAKATAAEWSDAE